MIDPRWMPRLHEYLGGSIRGMNGFPQGIGGTNDHVHLLVGLNSTHCLADLLRDMKKNSSTWVHEEIGQTDFFWQEGYAAFTVSSTARIAVQRYIKGQEEHHRVKSFREELVAMLKKAGIPYDEKYLD